MFLDLLETADESDRGLLCPAYAELVYMQRCVPNECPRVYTTHVYVGHS
jgi:hypothetical protein